MRLNLLLKICSLACLFASMAAGATIKNKIHEEAKTKSANWIEAKLDSLITTKLNKICMTATIESQYTCLAKGTDISAVVINSKVKKLLDPNSTYGLYWIPIKKSQDFKWIFRKEIAVTKTN